MSWVLLCKTLCNMRHRIRFESWCWAPSCYNSTDNQGQTAPTLIIKLFFFFSSLIIPTRTHREISAVNTLYIFMFGEVLFDLCVNRVTSLMQETPLSVEGTLISLPAFITFNNESISHADKMWLSEVCVCVCIYCISHHCYKKRHFFAILLMID